MQPIKRIIVGASAGLLSAALIAAPAMAATSTGRSDSCPTQYGACGSGTFTFNSSDTTSFKYSMSVKDTNCKDGTAAFVQLWVQYTNANDGQSSAYWTTTCGAYRVVNGTWNTSKRVKRVTVMIGSRDVFQAGNWVDNPYT